MAAKPILSVVCAPHWCAAVCGENTTFIFSEVYKSFETKKDNLADQPGESCYVVVQLSATTSSVFCLWSQIHFNLLHQMDLFKNDIPMLVHRYVSQVNVFEQCPQEG